MVNDITKYVKISDDYWFDTTNGDIYHQCKSVGDGSVSWSLQCNVLSVDGFTFMRDRIATSALNEFKRSIRTQFL